jgi:hypothetical protein
VATITSLVDRVRIELGDIGKTFVQSFVADGSTNRFKLGYAPLDGTSVTVVANGVDISTTSWVEESSGVLVTAAVPADGVEILVSGLYHRYFTSTELAAIVTNAVNMHTAQHTDSLGRSQTVTNLPVVEEYPVVIFATTLALYTLATDASFDIDIAAPDGVSIPRSERYRQLSQEVQTRQEQYRHLCMQLGVGLYKVDVYTLRRVSKATGRYVPVYAPQEVDDRSYPERIHLPMPNFGNQPVPWETEAGSFTAYQGRAWTDTIDFAGTFTGKSFIAYLLNQRGSVLVVQNFGLSVLDHGNGTYTATLSLTANQTMYVAERTYWSLESIDDTTGEKIELKGGNFYTVRVSTAVL